MEQYAGIDVSLELSSVCVVDGAGKVIREAKVPSQPGALVGFFQNSIGHRGALAWRPAPCRSGCTPAWRPQASTWCSWKRGTSRRHSRP